MDIKNKPTLAEKQAFWAEQLPSFEAKYWLPSHFELLEFDMEGGNYEVRDVLPEHCSENDATEIWHRVNTGWAMWKKAINFTKAQVPESNALLSAAIDAVQKLGSGDFVLVKKVKLIEIIGAIAIIEPITRGNPYMDFVKRELNVIGNIANTAIKAQEQSHEHS